MFVPCVRHGRNYKPHSADYGLLKLFEYQSQGESEIVEQRKQGAADQHPQVTSHYLSLLQNLMEV